MTWPAVDPVRLWQMANFDPPRRSQGEVRSAHRTGESPDGGSAHHQAGTQRGIVERSVTGLTTDLPPVGAEQDKSGRFSMESLVT